MPETDTAAEPLIADEQWRGDGNGEQDTQPDESALETVGSFIWGLTVCAGVSGLLFGYE
jgi:MFS transporter, SP family, solute carrier family 2 (myo-inositol transporter), member 13